VREQSPAHVSLNRVRQSLIVAIHISAGCLALALAMYYLLSNTLSFEFPAALLAQRPRILITGCFGFAAYCLLFSARRGELMGHKVLGYGALGLGLAIVWLILGGMEVSVA
jgi:hypothetical protein